MDTFRVVTPLFMTVLGSSVTNLLSLACLWTLDTFQIGLTNLLTLAGLWTLFGVVRQSVTNLLTLAGL